MSYDQGQDAPFEIIEVATYPKEMPNTNGRRWVVLVAGAVLGGIVAIPAAKFFLGGEDSNISLSQAARDATPEEWLFSMVVGSIVGIANYLQFRVDIRQAVSAPWDRFQCYVYARLRNGYYTQITEKNLKKEYLIVPHPEATVSGGVRLTIELIFSTVLSLSGGITFGGLYESSLAKASFERFLVFISMFLGASVFVRSMSFNFVHWLVNWVSGIGDAGWRDLLPKRPENKKEGLSIFLRLLFKYTSAIVLYNVLGSSLYGEVAENLKRLPDDEIDYSVSNVMSWGLFSIIVSVRMGDLAAEAIPQLWKQFKSLLAEFNGTKLMYFFLMNPIAFCSTASFFFSLRADVKAGHYDYLPAKIASHFQYIAATFGGIINVTCFADMFTDWIFKLKGREHERLVSGDTSSSPTNIEYVEHYGDPNKLMEYAGAKLTDAQKHLVWDQLSTQITKSKDCCGVRFGFRHDGSSC